MDALMENVPHMVPAKIDSLAQLDDCNPADVFMAMLGTGTMTLSQGIREVTKIFMVNSDDTSSIPGVSIALAIENAMIQSILQSKPGPNNRFSVKSIQSGANMIAMIVAGHQALLSLRSVHDRTSNRSPELVEIGWAALISNKADLDEFDRVHPAEKYLETRKIFLPQGATLIMHYWQRELNSFVAELESISDDPTRLGSEKAISYKLYNVPRTTRSDRIGLVDIAAHSNLPAPMSSGSMFSVQRESTPELAALLSRFLRTGVQSPNTWAQTCICFTGLLTVAERRESLKRVLWRPTKL